MFKKLINRVKQSRVVKHLFIMLLILIAGVVALFMWMGVYTNHGEFVVVPEIKGMTVEEAEIMVKSSKINLQIVDSIYDKELPRGVIIEQFPRGGSKVKQNRELYLTINTISPISISVPQLKDLSYRQAYSLLLGLGFPEPSVLEVESEYKDLVQRVRYQGRTVQEGEKLPITSKLQLVVGIGRKSHNPTVDTPSLIQ